LSKQQHWPTETINATQAMDVGMFKRNGD